MNFKIYVYKYYSASEDYQLPEPESY